MPKIMFDDKGKIIVLANFDELCIALEQCINADAKDLDEDDAIRLEELAKSLRIKIFNINENEFDN